MTLAMCLAALILLNMAMIFHFSAASKEESGEHSAGVTRLVMRLLYPDFEELAPETQQAVMQGAHKFVRKAAHFCEFALLGLLSAGLMLFISRYLKRLRVYLTWFSPIIFTLLYAIFDEVHQKFSGRGSRATDVLIDFSGALCGILLIHGLVWLCNRRMRAEQSIPFRRKKETP